MGIHSIRFDRGRIAAEYARRGGELHQRSIQAQSFLKLDQGTWPLHDLARLRRMNFTDLKRQFPTLDPNVRESIANQLRRFVINRTLE